MRALKLLAALALAACNNTPEAAPVDSGPLLRDIVAADAPADAQAPTDVQTPTDVQAPIDAQAPTDAQTPTDAQDAAAPVDIPDASASTDAPSSDAGAADASCVSDGGCYACPPTTPTQFLNQCTTAACAPFDNRARLTRLLADGGLPPLP
jgi:hypothetical protein